MHTDLPIQRIGARHAAVGFTPDHRSDPPSPEALDDADPSTLQTTGLGTWQLDVGSNTLRWSRRTARIFGLERTFAASYETFLERVHDHERAEVASRMGGAIRERGGALLEFRVRRQDGAMRWVVCTAEAVTGRDGRTARLVGVVFDVTEKREGRAQPRPADVRMLSVGEVARLLGISEATLKRLTDTGELDCIRDRRGKRRFVHDHVVEYLRKNAAGTLPASPAEAADAFAELVRAGDLPKALALLVHLAGAGQPVEKLIDALIVPLIASADDELIEQLFERIAVLGPPAKSRTTALLIPVAGPARGAVAAVRCTFRSRGIEALIPSGGLSVAQAAELAARTGVQVAALVFSGAQAAADEAGAFQVGLPRGIVLAYGARSTALPPGLVAVRSIEELAAILDGVR